MKVPFVSLSKVCNLLSWTVLSLATLGMPAPAFGNAEGGNTSGGGDSERSTQIAVEFETSGASSNVSGDLQTAGIYGDAKADAMAARIRAVVDLDKVAKGTGYRFSNRPCFDSDSKGHMGGAVIGDAKTPFCLSMPELRKLPREALFVQIVGIMTHELAHQAGYGEEDALYLQSIALNRLQIRSAYNRTRIKIDSARMPIGSARQLIMNQAPIQQICVKLGSADAILDNVVGAVMGLDGLANYDQVRKLAEEVEMQKFSVYCDGSRSYDQVELESALKISITQLDLILDSMPRNLGW